MNFFLKGQTKTDKFSYQFYYYSFKKKKKKLNGPKCPCQICHKITLKIENEVLHINEELRAYFHIMFDAQWVVQFRNKFVGKVNYDMYDISHSNYVIDLVTVSRNKIIFTTN